MTPSAACSGRTSVQTRNATAATAERDQGAAGRRPPHGRPPRPRTALVAASPAKTASGGAGR